MVCKYPSYFLNCKGKEQFLSLCNCMLFYFHSMCWSMWCLQVFYWSIHTFLGYILMLAIMSYNVYINIAIVLGGCLGYWIFGPKLIELNQKRFQKRQKFLNCDDECAGKIQISFY